MTGTETTFIVLDGAGDTKYIKGKGAGTSGDPFIPYKMEYPTVNLDETSIVHEYLLDGSTVNMGVDGTTPVTYSAIPASGKFWHITGINIFLKDAADLTYNTFGNIAVLTNGLSITCNGTEIFNFKDNTDILASSHDSRSVLDGTKTELFHHIDMRSFDGEVTHGLHVPASTGITAIVQDNLSGLVNMRIAIQGKEFTI